jgi:hypothetical protein
MNKLLLAGLVVIVSVGLIGGFMAVGGPAYARLEKQDLERSKDLQDLFRYLECRPSNEVLPKTLEDESYCPSHRNVFSTKDPVTGENYMYRRLDDTQFEVCAIYATDAQKGSRGYPSRALKFDGKVGCRAGTAFLKSG